MVRCALLVALVAGCFEDRYECTSDEQCDAGEAGRCETTGYCSAYDVSCETTRRYGAHAGVLTEQCVDDRIIPRNACTGGQTPALREGCFAEVCNAVPACCTVAWTDVCVQVAQQLCDGSCDTRLALVATRGMTTELYDVQWTGQAWTTPRRDDLAKPFVWLPPAPGEVEPRIGAMIDGELAIGASRVSAPSAVCGSIASIPFDRDGRDKIVAQFELPDLSTDTLLFDVAGATRRSIGRAALVSWGDENRDAFPDAISKSGGQYTFHDNQDSNDHVRYLLPQTLSNVTGGVTLGSPPIRTIEWIDLDRDTALDLVVFGNSVRIHTTPDDLNDIAQFDLDCVPPNPTRSCMNDPEPNLRRVSFVGTAVDDVEAPYIVLATFPDRKLYRARLAGGGITVEPLAFPGDACACQETCTNCPGDSCTCMYDCASCAPVLALVSRDLDGDHRLDLIAIDAKLRIYTALAAANYVFGAATPIVNPLPNNFVSLDVSVAGAPIP